MQRHQRHLDTITVKNLLLYRGDVVIVTVIRKQIIFSLLFYGYPTDRSFEIEWIESRGKP